MKKILFIDRDGTLIEEPADYQVDRLNKIRLYPNVIPVLRALIKADYQLVMITNQDGLGTSSFPWEDFQICQDFIQELFASQGIKFSDIFICPHRESDNCLCRKPKTGLLKDFLKRTDMDKSNSWMIGDRDTDRQLAVNLGISYLPVSKQNGWQEISETILKPERCATISRKTNETSINLTLSLDSEKPDMVETPIAFFSHMLEQIARHGGFSLQLQTMGDLEVDDHHLIEDTALALGEALRQALGDKVGIGRYGFTLPMDESLAAVAIDLSGRIFCSFEAPFTREFVGGMATEMVPHFFNSLAQGLGANIHVSVKGANHHHMIEACFKALGRALRQAITIQDNNLPSTKGVL